MQCYTHDDQVYITRVCALASYKVHRRCALDYRRCTRWRSPKSSKQCPHSVSRATLFTLSDTGELLLTAHMGGGGAWSDCQLEEALAMGQSLTRTDVAPGTAYPRPYREQIVSPCLSLERFPLHACTPVAVYYRLMWVPRTFLAQYFCYAVPTCMLPATVDKPRGLAWWGMVK